MLNEIAFLVFIGCILIYICVLLLSIKRKKTTKLKFLKQIYNDLVNNRLEDENQLLAIQTLRNFIIGNSIFISAFFILLGLIVGFYSSGFFVSLHFWGNLNFDIEKF